MTTARESVPCSRDNGLSSILLDDPQHVPTHTLDHVGSTDVFDVLPSVAAVVVAVILEGDHRLVPTHIEVCDEFAVCDSDLRGRRRQPRPDQDKPQPGLFW